MPPSPKRNKECSGTHNKDTITVVLSFKTCFLKRIFRRIRFGEGKSTNEESALTRPFRRLFNTGKPIGKINYIFFKGNRWPTRILGALCFTPGKRLLFFPGLNHRKINWKISHKGKKVSFFFNLGLLDHFTLEKDFKKWHVTMITSPNEPKVKLPSFKTQQIERNIIFWFGLTIQSQDVLEMTPEEHMMIFSCLAKDSERRVKLLLDAREGAVFHIVHLPEKVKIRLNEFVHFDFFIAPHTVDIKKFPCFVPIFEPMVQNYSQVEGGTPIRAHPVMLPSMKRRVWVVVSKHQGKVSEKSIITTF